MIKEEIDITRTAKPDFYWANDDTRTFMSRGYLRDGQTVEDRCREIADHAGNLLGIPGFADKFYHYLARGYYSLATPIWTNFGKEYGLPISCFGSYVPDSMDGIFKTLHEVAMMSKYGGGTSSYWNEVRSRLSPIRNNGLSEGAVNFMRAFNTGIDVSKQGESRRGVHAAYLDISHGDIMEFMQIKSLGNPIQNIFSGVCISDQWMTEMLAGDEEKRDIWAALLDSRSKNGIPYIFFTDNVNNGAADVYRDNPGLYKIVASNVCTEITLPQNHYESFVCDLSSYNLEQYDEWKNNPEAIQMLIMFLDAVMTEFITKASSIPGFERAVRFAERHRAVGAGVIGHFTLLHQKMIAFESPEGEALNEEIYSLIQRETLEASKKLAELFGEPEVLKGYGRRNTTLTTLAPTTSSSFIMGGVSQSIEPLQSNYFVRDLAKIKTTFKNPYLLELLESLGKNSSEVWQSIKDNNGSVQHLDFLTQHQKNVFKTFGEISQIDILRQAAARQKFIDQSQSLNLAVHPDTPARDLHQLHIEAWGLGIKTLYYQFSLNAAQEFRRELVTCAACEA